MKIIITVGETVFLIADQTSAVNNEGTYHCRLLNELALEEQFDALGTAPITIALNLRNDDAFIGYDTDLWAANVLITANNGRSWAGKVTSWDNDVNAILNIEVTEKTAPELKFYFPDEINRLYTIDENSHMSAINCTLPIVIGGSDENPLRLKGVLVNTEEGIYAFCVGEIHKFVGVRIGGVTLTVAEANSIGHATFTGSPSQANYPGMVYIQITVEALRKNDDGTYVELGAELVGLKFGTHTIEECRNGARALYWIMKTPSIGASGWGLGIDSGDINTDAFNEAISAVDAAGLKMDGVFYFKQIAMSWIRQICLAIRGTYSIGSSGLRSLFVDAPASSIKTYTINNMRLLNHGKGAFTGRVYNLGELDYAFNPITGIFMQKAQYQNSPSVDKIDEQKFYGQSYLINDAATAQAIVEYTCKRSLIAAYKVLFETDDLPSNAKKGSVVTIDRLDKGITGLYQISKIKITDHIHTIEAEKYDVDSFVVGGSSTNINWTEQPPIVSSVNPGNPSGLTLSSEVIDGTSVVVLRGTFTAPDGGYMAASIDYGEGLEPTYWVSCGQIRGNSFEIKPVKAMQTYAVRVQMVTSTAHSDFVIATITTAGDEIAPDAPVIARISTYLKNVAVGLLLTESPADMAGFIVYRNTENNIETATEAGKVVSKTTTGNASAIFQDTVDAVFGIELYYWAKAFDSWENISEPSAPVHFTLFGKLSDYVWLGDADSAFWIGGGDPETAIVLMNPDGTGKMAGLDLTASSISKVSGDNIIAINADGMQIIAGETVLLGDGTGHIFGFDFTLGGLSATTANGTLSIDAGTGEDLLPKITAGDTVIAADSTGIIAGLPFDSDKFTKNNGPFNPTNQDRGVKLDLNLMLGDGEYYSDSDIDANSTQLKTEGTAKANTTKSGDVDTFSSNANLIVLTDSASITKTAEYSLFITYSGKTLRRSAGTLSAESYLSELDITTDPLPEAPAEGAIYKLVACVSGLIVDAQEYFIELDKEVCISFDNKYSLQIRLANETLIEIPIRNDCGYTLLKFAIHDTDNPIAAYFSKFVSFDGPPENIPLLPTVGQKWAFIPSGSTANSPEIIAKNLSYASAGMTISASASEQKDSAILTHAFGAAANVTDVVPFGLGNNAAKDAYYSPTELRLESKRHHTAILSTGIIATNTATPGPAFLADSEAVTDAPDPVLARLLELNVICVTAGDSPDLTNDNAFYGITPAQYFAQFPELSDGVSFYRCLPEVLLKAFQEYVAQNTAKTTSLTAGFSAVPEYADNAAAVAGGLAAGDIYRTGDLLKITH